MSPSKARYKAARKQRRNAQRAAAQVLLVAPIEDPLSNPKAVRRGRVSGAHRVKTHDNRRSLWSESQNYKTAATIDARWSNTVTDERTPGRINR